MKKSKIASFRHVDDGNERIKKDDPFKYNLTNETEINRINKQKGFKPLYPPERQKKRPKTEQEMLEDIINKKQNIKKVRKFFHKYVEKQNELEEQNLGFISYLKDTVD